MVKNIKAFFGGGIIGILGGLVGLGGAEFRLPMLISIFGFAALSAVILNKAMSLIVVAFSFVFRSNEISYALLFDHSTIILSMLFGSVIGAWFGAGYAIKLKSELLYKIIGFLLLFIAVVLVLEHYFLQSTNALFESEFFTLLSGVFVGGFIGIVAAILGVAGGELYIPAIILIYGVDIKLAGSLSLAISLPTMLVAFFRYSKDKSFEVIYKNKYFVIYMGFGSILGAYIGASLLGIVSNTILIPLLSIILIISSYKMYKHKEAK
jgi:uncharacterized membrane protein YfcA